MRAYAREKNGQRDGGILAVINVQGHLYLSFNDSHINFCFIAY